MKAPGSNMIHTYDKHIQIQYTTSLFIMEYWFWNADWYLCGKQSTVNHFSEIYVEWRKLASLDRVCKFALLLINHRRQPVADTCIL